MTHGEPIFLDAESADYTAQFSVFSYDVLEAVVDHGGLPVTDIARETGGTHRDVRDAVRQLRNLSNEPPLVDVRPGGTVEPAHDRAAEIVDELRPRLNPPERTRRAGLRREARRHQEARREVSVE
jgi:hypothetical protein